MPITRADIEAAKTEAESKALIGTLVDDFTALRSELSEKESVIADHAEKLRLTQQKLSELRIASEAGQTASGAEGEAEMRAYIDGDTVRLMTDRHAVDRGEDALPGLLDGEARCEWQRELQEAFAQRTMIRVLNKKGEAATIWNGEGDSRSCTPILDKRIGKLIRNAPASIASQIRAMGDEAGKGGDWIVPPTINMVRDQIHVKSTIASLFRTQNLDRGGMDIPTISNGIVPFQQGVPSGDSPGNIPVTTLKTGMDQVRPADLAAAVAYHRRASERSMINYFPQIVSKIGKALNYALADCIVNANGTTAAIDAYAPGGTHWDPRGVFGYSESAGYPVAVDRRNGIWEGLRNRAKRIDAAAGKHWVDASGGFSLDMLQDGLGSIEGPMGGDGATVLSLSREAFFKHVAKWSQVQTVDKFGNRATVHEREIARVAGCRLVTDDFLTADLNATGVYDGVTKTTTSALLFNREEWTSFLEMAARIETKVEILNGIVYVVISWGGTFQCDAPTDRKNIVAFTRIAA